MSFTNRPTAPPTMFTGVHNAVEHALRQVGPHIAALVDRSAPSPAMVRALGDELVRAQRDPRAVAHPELLDPVAFWSKQAWPQAAAVVKNARSALLTIADEVTPLVRGSEQILDGWLVAQIEANVSRADLDPAAARDEVIDAMVGHCEALHRVVAQLGALAPTIDRLADARAVVDVARRQQAEQAAIAQRDAEASSVPAEHRAAFDKAWAEGFEQDVAVRDQELRMVSPFRHQELLVMAHEKAIEAIAEDVDAMVQELTEPILGIGERLVRRYDELAGGGMHHRPAASPGFSSN